MKKGGIKFLWGKEKKYKMNNCKRQTGYASVDKPWLQFYAKDIVKKTIPKMSAYDYVMNNSTSYKNECAINYFDRKITYKQMQDNIEEVIRAFTKIGVNEGMAVAFLVPTLPESIYSFYALNKIHAISCWIDPRCGVERIARSIKEAKAHTIVIIDLLLPKLKEIEKFVRIKNAIVLSAAESLPLGTKILFNLKRKNIEEDLNEKCILWKQFIKNGCNYKEKAYTGDYITAIEYTSGTSSTPKGVVILNDAINALAYQYKLSGVEHHPGDIALNVMPLFLMYGLACGVHMPFSLGMTNVVIPNVSPDNFPRYVKKYRPQHFMVNPILFDSLVNSDEMKDVDFSGVISPAVGGSAISSKKEEEYNLFLKKHNNGHKLAKGYGATEAGSAFAAVISNESDQKGSVGIPLPLNTVSVFSYSLDEENEIVRSVNELRYNEEGEICITGPTLMKEYLNNSELTNKVLIKHKDGKIWLHTGDRGYINERGNIFVYDRIGRMIITPDSHNIYLASIEEVINSHIAVDECAVVGIKVDGYEKGKLPKAVIKLKEEYINKRDTVIRELIELNNRKLPERDVARYYEILEEFPMTLGGKIDYKKLEKTTKGQFVDANIIISELI